ncbi:barstar family protein [Scytonema sp. PCC 10023]|uniref:barstar family protein n=1 Tax=Scytonema sp. PCC 10023 TaxID=1680591 RepID=UPI0039C66572
MNEYVYFQRTPARKPEIMANRKQIIDKIIEELSQQGIQVFYLDGREISSKETFLSKAAQAMKFPAYFGANWDAFDECITDLTWCPAERYVLLYDRPDIFAQADPTQWQIAVDILRSAEEYWGTTNTQMDVFLMN